jgi:DNA modification methylase
MKLNSDIQMNELGQPILHKTPCYVQPGCQLYNEDFKETIKRIGKIDFILTDPPYPDYMVDEYKYYDGIINFLNDINCKQLVFWSAKVEFPLTYSSIHIWDKKCGVGSMYERIFERNGGNAYKVYNYYLINSTVAASYAKDTFEGHPSQKPINLIRDLILEYTKEGDTIFDPFSGSGTTAVACIKEKRNFIGSELNKIHYDKSVKRIQNQRSKPELF